MTYRERRLAKAERLREWAEKRDVKALQHRAATDEHMALVPMGQPFLVGHHSERRARNEQARFVRNMDKNIEHSQKAEEMRQKAENIEEAANHAIYSDDHDAIERLEGRIAAGLAKRAAITAFNKTARKGQPDYLLLSDDLSEKYDGYVSVMAIKRGEPFPSYATSNMSANTRRLQKRLEALKRKSTKGTTI